MLPAMVVAPVDASDIIIARRRRQRSGGHQRRRFPAIFVVAIPLAALLSSSVAFRRYRFAAVQVSSPTTSSSSHYSHFDAPRRYPSSSSSSSFDVNAPSSAVGRRRRGGDQRNDGDRQHDDGDDHQVDDDGPLDEADYIIRKSYAETYGRMPHCEDRVGGKDCIARAVEQMDRHRRGGGHNDSSTVGVGVVTSRATLDVGQGRSSSDPPPSSSSRRRFVVRDDHPYPWWFVTLLRDLPSSGVYGPWHELDTSSTIPRPLKFCAIGKNGCTEWRKVFKSLNAHEYCDDDDEEEHVVEGRKRAVACGASKFNTRAVLDENDVPRSVFLRDPLERLLSGYLDKCVKPNVRVFQGHCEPNVVFGVDHLRRKEGQGNGKKVGGSPPPDMTVVLKDFEREMFASYVDLLPLKWNVHFVPQSFVCDLYRKIDDYDFVGIMGRDFARELDRMANRYGGSLPDALDVAFDYRSKIINDTLVVDNVGSDKAHGTKAPAKVHRYYSPGTVRRALEYLSIDYVALGLEVPLWAREMLRDDAGNRT